MKGGHAGGEIAKGRGNASVLLGRLLLKLSRYTEVEICHVQSGDEISANKHGIPDRFTAEVTAASNVNIEKIITEFYEEIRPELERTDEDIALSYETLDCSRIRAIDRNCAADIAEALLLLPNGVFSMHKYFTDTPECSNNIGNLEIDRETDTLVYYISVRSSKVSLMNFLSEKIHCVARLKGFQISAGTPLPGWEFEPNAALKKLIEDEYLQTYGEKPRFKITHASTECGLFKRELADLEIISMGPIIYEEHTVNEYMGIDSVAELWKFLCRVLEKCKDLPERGQ